MFPDATYNTGKNLYHEIINLFKADNGNFFIYLNRNGKYNDSAPDFVLNIVKAGEGLYQILSKAKINEKPDYKNQAKDMAKYGGVDIGNLFGENDDKERVFATFKCENIIQTKRNIYIQFPKSKSNSTADGKATYGLLNLAGDYVFKMKNTKIGQDPRVVNIDKDDLNTLNSIIEDEKNWQDGSVGTFDERRGVLENKTKCNEENFFSLLGVDKQELQYSNAIAKILQFKVKEDLVPKFFKYLVGTDKDENNTFEILREENDVDILIRDLSKNGKIVIIENKIDAGLTLSNYENLSAQATAVFCDVFGKEEENEYWNNYKDFFSNENNSPSQLSKYYFYALCWALKAGWEKNKIEENIYCFFLCPNYRKYKYATENDKLAIPYAFANKYKLITYSTIKGFFVDINNKKELTCHQKFILEDFLDAISNLAKDRDDSIELDMIRMFIERHDKLKSI